MSDKSCFVCLVVALVVVAEVAGFNGGIRNFKFRKKEPEVSGSKSVDLKRYFDGELGHLVAFEGSKSDFSEA